MFERITEAEINERSMANVSTTPGRKTAFGEGGMDAKALKLRFDRLGRFLAGRLNELFDGLKDGELANSLYIDTLGGKMTLKGFISQLQKDAGSLIRVSTDNGVVTLTQLGNDVAAIVNDLENGELAKRLFIQTNGTLVNLETLASTVNLMREGGEIFVDNGVSLLEFYRDFREYKADSTQVTSVNGKVGRVVLNAEDVGAERTGSINQHNASTEAHSDIRLELKTISERLAAVLDSDDTTLDELSEIVAYIKNNKELIAAITTSKVSVVDIINDLTTSRADRPLSAAQGVVLKSLIDKVAADAGKDVYILSKSETLDDVPDNISIVIDPNGEDILKSETWTFELADGSSVEKRVALL